MMSIKLSEVWSSTDSSEQINVFLKLSSHMASPNILLVVLDAVRPDHCSCYGYDRKTTPNIDKISEEGVQYTNAFSNSSWTAEAHGTLFTGYPSSVSGVYGEHLILPKSIPTLPELLQNAGYNTFGASAGAHIRADRGYDRGFSKFCSTVDLGLEYKIKPKITGDIRSSLENYLGSAIRGGDRYTHFKARALERELRRSQRPFFGFVNFKTAHNPYKDVPEPYKSYFTNDSIRPDNPILDFIYRVILEREPDSIDGIDYDRLCEIDENFPLLTDKFEPTEEEWQVIKDWYDGAIRYIDHKIGMILRSLEESDELENTWIIVTADHGELFGEHGLEKHVFSLYEQLLRVPLIIRSPNRTSRKSSSMCSWIDLYPTICEIAGINHPDRPHAKSLLPLDNDPDHQCLYAEVARKSNPRIKEKHPNFKSIRQNGPLQSIRDESWKLIRYPSGEVDLFNWITDPEEQQECSDQNADIVKKLTEKMESELESMDSSSHNEADEILSPDIEKRLESLGYR